MIRAAAAAALLAQLSLPALAQMSPVGLWRTISDTDGSVRSEVRITEAAGVVSGRIERVLDAKTKPDAICDACKDERKNKPIVGLEIIRDARQSEGRQVWEGGNVLDPDNGTIYRLKLTPVEGGKKLEVRGFIGFALLGRTQTWVRAE